MAYFTDLEQIFQKFIWNQKRPWIASEILRKKQSWRDHNTKYQTVLQHKDIVIKTAWHWHKKRHIDQSNRKENPETTLPLYGQLIFDKGGKSIQWSKSSLFSKWCWKNWTGTYMQKKKNESRPLLHHTQE